MTHDTQPIPRRDITHDDIARALAAPSGKAPSLPTDEQLRVLDAPFAPTLVMAGAGSGKTHTMTGRILSLIVREGQDPASILGLTFTRKAAGELRARVRSGLASVRRAGLLDEGTLEMPEITTYNSYANAVYRDNALVIGVEPDATLLDEASAWMLMRSIIRDSTDDRLLDMDLGLASLTQRALDLARAARENDVSADDITAYAHAMRDHLLSLPSERARKSGEPLKIVRDTAATISELEPLAELARAYERAKRERGFLEFSDQVQGAAEICQSSPGVADELRERARHVILDEYQDTSVGQVRFLSALFHDQSVMAVGDPKQAIYGWRGASSGTMERFHDDFSRAPGTARAVLTLSTSWRNDARILDAANAIAAKLPGADDIPELRARDGAGTGEITLIGAATEAEEAVLAARSCAELLDAGRAGGTTPPTIAMLFRRRAPMATFARALSDAGVPHHVVGLGGVITSPEVTDLMAFLRVAFDPDSGNWLIRLLLGPHVGLGPADIQQLHAVSRRLAHLDHDLNPTARHDAGEEAIDLGADSVTLLEAVEAMSSPRVAAKIRHGMSDDAVSRLASFSRLIAEIRSLHHLPVTTIVEETIRLTRLDIETVANPRNTAGRRNLDAFSDAIASMPALQRSVGIAEALDWLEAQRDRDDIAITPPEPEPGTVQLITMHGAKGLEWDRVIIPRSVEKEFPQASRSSTGWLSRGVLPYELRADGDALPVLDWRGATTQQELDRAVKAFKADVTAHQQLEERRLAYVAVTRARKSLILTAAPWSTGRVTPRDWTPFIQELVEAGVLDQSQVPVLDLDDRDGAADIDHPVWPRPFASAESIQRARDAAHAVEIARDATLAISSAAASASSSADTSALAPAGNAGTRGQWTAAIDLLLRERAQRSAPPAPRLPERIPASRFHEIIRSPGDVVAQLRRPMPTKPHRQTRLGTMFHAWVQARYEAPAGISHLFDDEVLDLGDDELALLGLEEATQADQVRLRELQERFLGTAWASKRPIAVEQSIEVPLGEQTVLCKIDAVFDDGDGRVRVVDWKTGKKPEDETSVWERQLQLALYTLAWSKHSGVPIDRIRATLVYIATGDEVTFDSVESEERLAHLLDEAQRSLTEG